MVNNIVKKCAIVLVSFILISLTNTVCFAQKKETTKSIKKQKSKKTKDKTLDSYFYGGKNKKKKGDKKDKKGISEKKIDTKSMLKANAIHGEKTNANSGGSAKSQTSYRPIYVGNKMVTGSISSNQGFRVCLYTGNNREEAMAAKMKFMQRFSGIRSYMSYNTPYYKIKVGDFADKKMAQKSLKEFTKVFPAAFIVPDIVTIKNILIYKKNQLVTPVPVE
jgi:SPOR domain